MKIKTLEEITSKISSGATPRGGQSAYKSHGISLIRSQNVYDFSFSRNGLAFIDEEQSKKLDNVAVESGDILFNITGDSIARTCMVPEEILPARVNQHVSIIRCKDDYDSRYVNYYLINLKSYLLQICGVGGTRNALTKEALQNLEIKILLSQKQIAKALSDLDAKIEVNNKVNAELEAMAKLIYDYWFVQFDFPDENGRPYKSYGGKMVYNEELKREIPEGWEVVELKDCLKSNRGVSYSSKDIDGEGIPMINLNSFNTDSTYKPDGIKSFSGTYNDSKVLKPLDLVMCNTQQTSINSKTDIIGKSFLIPDIFKGEIVSSHHVTTIKVEKDNLKYYLNTLFNTEYFHRYISGYATGTNILGLDFSGVLSYKAEIPNDELLNKYKSIIVNVEKQRSIAIKENQKLSELRDWLLPMLMNGQVTVGEAEEHLGMVAEEELRYGK